MKPNDKAYEAAKVECGRWTVNSSLDMTFRVIREEDGVSDKIAEFTNREERDEALERLRAEAMVNAAYAAQFQGEDYAGLVKKLRSWRGCIASSDDCLAAADAIEAVLAERDDFAEQLALRSESGMAKDMQEIMRINNELVAERDALLARLAPVEDEALVERDALKKAVEAEQSMTKLRFGPFLKKVRQEKQMTLRAVEEATDKEISNAYLSQLESGKIANPSPHVLYTLSLVFGVAYETLMERAGYVMPAPNRLAPVDDEALVEIAAHCEAIFDGWTFSSLEKLSQDVYRVRAHQLLASIRPHIEAAERERCAKIAEAFKGNDSLYCPTDAGREGYVTACREIAAAIRSGK